jgi:hypothetical protein
MTAKTALIICGERLTEMSKLAGVAAAGEMAAVTGGRRQCRPASWLWQRQQQPWRKSAAANNEGREMKKTISL